MRRDVYKTMTYGTTHAEIGTIQQVYDAGLTKNESMIIIARVAGAL
ncbi:cytidine deaminase-like fold-containing protein [Ralstonia solanacearum]